MAELKQVCEEEFPLDVVQVWSTATDIAATEDFTSY